MGKSRLAEINDEEEGLSMTSMIDVTFLLLIFFMCTIKFKTLEGKLSAYLPKDVGVNSSDAEPILKVEIELRVVEEGVKLQPEKGKPATQPWTGEGRYVFAPGTRQIMYVVGPKKYTDLNELGKRLSKLHEEDDERPATISARRGVVYGDVVPVLDAAIEAEFTEVTFVGAPVEKKK